ncbi:ABC transporter permease [Pseudoalteromonas sp. SMS1]|uniref:ABC transporter permease n=1 Tax=Pseudoalteromonas sp. SMS1 TaxID=2908894 RepID=UPI001F27809B|nr:ABC transporter permease [Pseudoalteromonas sp. SMS1]MCF2859721.1 ABC transporter permease [Pseudoalteromonas sp. SMS1]
MWKESLSAIITLCAKPRFTLVFVFLLTMALAGGLVVSLFYWQAYAPLPYTHADRLVWLHGTMVNRQEEPIMDNALSNMAAYHISSRTSQLELIAPIFYGELLYTTHAAAPQVNVTYTHPNFFTLFDLELRAGRYFNQTQHNGTREVVISECFAHRYMRSVEQPLRSMTELLSQSIVLDNQQYRIAGVVACSNKEPQLSAANYRTDVFMDFNSTINFAQPLLEHLTVRQNTFVVGRLKRSSTIKPVAPDVIGYLNQQFTQGLMSLNYGKGKHLKFKFMPLQDRLKAPLKRTSHWLLLGGSAFLLITLVNLFTFYLLEVKKQHSELALKVTLGAKLSMLRGAHYIQLSALFLISALCAMLLSEITVYVIKQAAASTYAHIHWLTIRWWHHVFMVGVALILSASFAKLGLSHLSFRHLHSQMHGAGKGQVKQLPHWLTVNVLITQLSVGIIVLCTTAWSSIYFTHRLSTPVGIDDQGVMFIERQQHSWGKEAAHVAARKQLFFANQQALLAHPKIESVALSAIMPFDNRYLASIGKTPKSADQLTVNSQLVGAGYFQLLGQKVVAGRSFNQRDTELRNVLIMNRQAASQLGIDELHIGMTLYPGNQPPVILIGIVEDIFTHTTGALPILYFPHNYYETNMLVKLRPGQTMHKSEVVALLKQQAVAQNVQRYSALSAQIRELNSTAMVSLIGGIGVCILIVIQVVVGLFGLLGNLALGQREVIRIKQQVGAKHRHLVREQVRLRLGHFTAALVIATSVILVIASVVTVPISILFFSYAFAVVFLFSLLFYIDIYHVYRQLKKD